MKRINKLLAMLLCAAMIFSIIPVQGFASEDETLVVTGENTVDTNALTQPEAEPAAASSGVVKVEHDGETTYYDNLQKAFDGFAPSNNTYDGTYVVTLMGDTTGVSKTLTYPTNGVIHVVLDLNGYTVSAYDTTQYVIYLSLKQGATVDTPNTFTLKDSSGDNSGKITGGKGGVSVNGKDCTFYFQGGTITGNHGANKGGGILMGATTFLNMTGGVVTGNSVTGSSSANSGYGGGILVNYGSITGGVITGNVAYKGSHVQSGRGGGIGTEITRTSGYNTLTIANGVVYGNTAENAGDDVMAQTNGLSGTKHTLVIGTENWYIDGWNGTKAAEGNGEAARYDELNPVPYTDGGFNNVNNKSVGLKYVEAPYDGPVYNITYTDGVEGEEIFADQTYKARADKATPAFKGTPERYGYVFAGWSPAVEEYPTQDMTYTAQWTALPAYTVTYTDGVEGEEIFADQVYGTYEGYETPAFVGTPAREHYIFTGWTPDVAATVTGDVTYTATWREAIVYTITYTDGVDGEEVFADQVFEVEEQQATPTYTFEGKRPGYKFSSWNPTVAKTVTGDATYTAKWTTCSHTYGTPVFDEEALTNTYTCTTCGFVKVSPLAAEINGTRYETLQAALSTLTKSTGNVTVKLLADTTECVSLTWASATARGTLNLTIDLNGHTITGTGSASVMTLKRTGTSTTYKWNIYIDDTSAEKTGTVTGGRGATGGAITVSGVTKNDTLTIKGGNFKNNTTTGNGGAIYLNGTTGNTLNIDGGVFEGNIANGNGGAIYATLVIVNGGTFKANEAKNTAYGGGAIYGTSTLTVKGGTFTGNTATGFGGALYAASALTISGGTITGNTANYGGGIAAKASKPVVNITAGQIYGNTATSYGDDLFFNCTGTAAPTLNLMAAADMGVDGVNNWYVDGYYIAAATERDANHVTVYEAPSALTKTTIALKAASHSTVTYTDGVEDEDLFADQVYNTYNGYATPAFDGTPAREGYEFAGWAPEVSVAVTADVTYTAQWNVPKVAPEAPSRSYNVSLFDIECEQLVGYSLLAVPAEYCSVGNVYEENGKYFCDITVALKEFWEKVEKSYWDDIACKNGEHILIDEFPEAAVVKFVWNEEAEKWDNVEEIKVYRISCKPARPEQPALPNNNNVSGDLVKIICDTDPNHVSVTKGWLGANTVYPTNAEPVWNAELGAWTIGVRIDSIGTYYVWDHFEEVYNDIKHEIVSGVTVNGNHKYIDTTLVWDADAKVWKTQNNEIFEIHTCCKTTPDAPVASMIEKYQIKVIGTVKGQEKPFFVNLKAANVTVGEVKGSRETGFTAEITVEFAEDDYLQAAWIAQHAPDATVENYNYDWEKTTAVTFTLKYTGDTTTELKGTNSGDWVLNTNGSTSGTVGTAYLSENLPEKPALPNNNNVSGDLVKIICDTDPNHVSVTKGWLGANTVYPTNAEPVWNAELGAWTIGVRIDSIGTYYVWDHFEEVYNDIKHEIVSGVTVNGNHKYIDTTLVWDADAKVWKTQNNEIFEIHTCCKTTPDAPVASMIEKYQIKVIGTVKGQEKPFFVNLKAANVTVGEVKGSRETGFTAEITVEFAEDDYLQAAWIAQHAPDATVENYNYDWEKTTAVTFTLKYTGDTTTELKGTNSGDWVLNTNGSTFGTVGTAYLTENIPEKPAAPAKLGENVTPELIKVICDSDKDHAPITVKWQSQSTKVYAGAEPEWNAELGAWTIKIRIDSISVYYVWLNFAKAYNEIEHDLIPDAPIPEGKNYIDTYLKWDVEKQLWVTMDGNPIDIHVSCQTAPNAPTGMPASFQIQVKGDLDGDGIYGEKKQDCALGVSELRAVTITADNYTIGEVYGNRKDGFFVDVTVTLEEGDIFVSTWIEYCAPGQNYVYNWDLTQKTVTFTLKYARSTTGTLYGSNKTDWAHVDGDVYKVGEAYVMPGKPAAPQQSNVTDKLVSIICDTDGDRHETVYGKWYPLGHCETTGEIVWNAEMGAWTVDVKIGSLYIMYVDKLEDANNGIFHELVDDVKTIYTTLKWDVAQQLWFPVEEIELHTTCKTAPDAPALAIVDGFQIKVYGALNGKWNAYTFNIVDGTYTQTEVKGSREEGFTVDVTVTITEDYLNAWVAKKAAGASYVYDWSKTPETVTFTLKYGKDLNGNLNGSNNGDWVLSTTGKNVGVVGEAYVIPAQPAAPTQATVTDKLVAIICDSDGDRHETVYGKWYPQHCSTTSEMVWNEEQMAWTVDVKIDGLYSMYVQLMQKATNDIFHDLVGDARSIYTTLKWDANEQLWFPVEEIELHTTCKTAPDAPVLDHIDGFQIKVFGALNGKWNEYNFNIVDGTYTQTEVKGSREEGFTVDVTVTITEDYLNAWVAKKAAGASYVYDWSKTPETVTFTLKYGKDLNGNLNGSNNGDWVLSTTGKNVGVVGEAYVIPAQPAAPTQATVTDKLVAIICDSDGDRHETVYGKWYPTHCSTTSEMVWNEETLEWNVDVRIGGLYIMYVDKLEDANNGTTHELVEDITTVFTTLIWDAEQNLWVPAEPIELHTTCRTAPVAPVYNQLKSYQIRVYGALNGKWEQVVISLAEGTYTLGEVKGSREEGFTVDVTVPLSDYFLNSWVDKKAPGAKYDWVEAGQTVTFTLKYNGSLTGTLHGDRHASNTNYDWVLATTGKTFGVVGEAYVIPAQPVAPAQANVTDKLVSIICDSDGDRHETVYGKWYPTHCSTTSAIVWNEETLEWNVDVRIGGLYIMYVDKLEDANYGTAHELVEDITTVFTTLIWDAEQNLWVPAEPIELHTTCRTAPVAPAYNQLESFQIKVYGDVNGEEKAYTTSIPEGAYTMSEVYGSREEGFFVDITTTLEEGDIYAQNWLAKRYPGGFYEYDWSKTVKTVTYTLKYNGSLNGTLYGDRHSNYAYDWVLATTGKIYGVVGEAYLVPMQFVLTLNPNGGQVNPETVTVTFGKAVGTLPAPERTGYTFAGWVDAEGNVVTAETIYTAGNDTTITAQWTANQYTLTLDAAGGTVDPAALTVTFNAAIGTLPAPERTGYTFTGWVDAQGNAVTAETVYTVAADSTITAQWVVNTYTVTFNPNGGAAIDSITVTFDAKYGTLPSSALTGFSGGNSNWYLVDENGNVTEVKITKTTIVSTARDHQLFVVRKILNPTVKIALTVPGGISNDYKYYIPGNSTRILTASVTNMNADELVYSYQWYKDGVAIEGATESVLTLAGNVVDSGTYKVVVTATLKDGSTVVVTNESASGEATQKVQIMRAANTLRLNENYGETPVTSDGYWGGAVATIRSAASGRVGYTFAGWNTAADGSGETYQVGDEVAFPGDNGNGGIVLELYAQWTANEYTLTLDAAGGTVDPAALTVTFDAAIGTLPTPVRTGYTFTGWVDAQGNAVTAETVYTTAAGSTITAQWVANTYTVTLVPNGGKVSHTTITVIYDAPIGTLPLPKRDGYFFGCWVFNNVAYTADTIYTVDGDMKLYASWFAKTYTLTLDAGEGTVDPATLTVTFDAAIGTLPAPQREGYTFEGWFDAEGKEVTAETVYTTTDNSTVTAKWTANKYTLTLDNGDQIEVTYNEPIGTLPTPEREGYTFEGWFDADGNAVTAETVYTGGALTLTAKWSANGYAIKLEPGEGALKEGDPEFVGVTYGAPVGEMPVPVYEGYTFMGWYDEDGVLVDEDTVYMYNGGITVTASWEQIPEEPAETGNNMIIYIVIILVLMAGVVVAIVVTKKRAAK